MDGWEQKEKDSSLRVQGREYEGYRVSSSWHDWVYDVPRVRFSTDRTRAFSLKIVGQTSCNETWLFDEKRRFVDL